jgi:hypothetical protein
LPVVISTDLSSWSSLDGQNPTERTPTWLVTDEIGVIDAYTGEALAQQMAVFRAVSEELGG